MTMCHWAAWYSLKLNTSTQQLRHAPKPEKNLKLSAISILNIVQSQPSSLSNAPTKLQIMLSCVNIRIVKLHKQHSTLQYHLQLISSSVPYHMITCYYILQIKEIKVVCLMLINKILFIHAYHVLEHKLMEKQKFTSEYYTVIQTEVPIHFYYRGNTHGSQSYYWSS